jgi:hypothetical protein
MSWLYSQALVEEYLGDISLDGEQSVQSSGNPTQLAYLPPDRMTEFSRLSRFGMMFKPLTEDRGEALLMSYLAAFHARTFPPQEKAQESTESDQECGEKWHGSFTRYDPDSSLWRTHQCSLLGDLEPFSETWPRWGLMRDGECWEQQMSALRTSETESGFVPNGETFFHTPNCTGMDGGSNSRKALKKRMLPTPTASMMPCEGTVRIMRKVWLDGDMSLEEASAIAGRDVRKAQGKVPMWPTPCATDHKGSGKTGDLRDRLDYAVERGATKSKDYTWPTPRTKGMCGGSGSWELLKKNTTIEEARQMGAGNGGKLNPMWVEWLMGWPLGWTDLKPLEMDKFQKWLEQHGA